MSLHSVNSGVAPLALRITSSVPPDTYILPKPKVPSPKRFSYGFQFWRQIQYFNVGSWPTRWFVSLLNRLGEMEKENIEDVRSGKRGFRFHSLNWNAVNIPIRKIDFAKQDCLGENFFDTNYLFQFQVSTGK